ncbi:MAG: tRNA glutamyl-Q(34) synthetase GluQRS [Pirellula sp.]
MSYVGRLAPSPTGAQHLGNARTFLVTWLACRQVGGKLLLRIEDLDTPRTKPGATAQAIEDLRWIGLDWDVVGPEKSFTVQSNREERYVEVLRQLKDRELVYPCTCTRAEVEEAASAPHESILDGAIYPGTCSHRNATDSEELDHKGLKYAWRFRMPSGIRSWTDRLYGEQALNAKVQLGDFVVGRSYGVTAYQLAVVVDDHDFGINHVVRGNDLMFSTFRQIAIYEALGWDTPAWLHLPLVVGPDGRRLAKRHGDTRLSLYREQGMQPEQIVGYLAETLCLRDRTESVTPRVLLRELGREQNWIDRMPRENVTKLVKKHFK